MSTNDSSNSLKCVESSRSRKRKSRWSDAAQVKTSIPGMPTVLPNTFTPQQQEIYVLQLQIEEISRQLRANEVTIPAERSPSPEPIYDLHGKRLNTRVCRVRGKMKEQRHRLIQQLKLKNPCFKPPADYKPPADICSERVSIPQEEYTNINFIGLLIGPRGNTLKAIEKDTGAKIIIRGKGSAASSKVKSAIAADEPLHALVTANTSEAVAKAVSCVQEIIKQGVNEPNLSNQLRRQQLLELAQINGTVRQPYEKKGWSSAASSVVCLACGGGGHITSDCRSSKQPHNQGKNQCTSVNAVPKYDESYMEFLAEIGDMPSWKKNRSSGTQANESCGNNPISVEGQSRADSLQASVPLAQQSVSCLYPSPNNATFPLVDSATAVALGDNTDPLLTYYAQSTASRTPEVSGQLTEFSLPVSTQLVHQPPSDTSTSAFMNLAHEHCNYVSPAMDEYGIEPEHYLNLGYLATENTTMYGCFLPQPGNTPSKQE